ncbi:PLD nuclease N-terminal domain-containing protein [bacterium]|nr:PLD nuclease N-terminal domain-containing protein [bacterium]
MDYGYSLVGLLILVLDVVAIVDCLSNPRRSVLSKVLWMLAILIFPCIGMGAYYLVGRQPG